MGKNTPKVRLTSFCIEYVANISDGFGSAYAASPLTRCTTYRVLKLNVSSVKEGEPWSTLRILGKELRVITIATA